MELSELFNLILGGGLLATAVGVLTLRQTVRRATAEAEKAKAEAETVRIDNAEHATRILIENIVEPLKKELNETREELRDTKREFGSTKREMARFRKAVETANNCKFRVDCPVLYKLRDLPKGGPSAGAGRDAAVRGQPCAGGEGDKDGSGADVGGDLAHTGGQPP